MRTKCACCEDIFRRRWITRLTPKRSDIEIPDSPVILMIDGVVRLATASDLLDVVWFFAAANSSLMVSDCSHVVPTSYWAHSFHYTCLSHVIKEFTLDRFLSRNILYG